MFLVIHLGIVTAISCDSCNRDGVCDILCNNIRCLYDFGACKGCSLGCISGMIADGICEPACFVPECSYDAFDCLSNCNENCDMSYIGDGICDETCNNELCHYDGGDCDYECAPGCNITFLGNGNCDTACINQECGFDQGDCEIDVYVSPGGTGFGFEFDPFGSIEEAFNSIFMIGMYYIHLSPGVYYINETIYANFQVGVALLGNSSEIRVRNLSEAFNIQNLLYFEVSDVTFDGSEYWVSGCNSPTCMFAFQWLCLESTCFNLEGDTISIDNVVAMTLWKNCVSQEPLIVFTLISTNLTKFSNVTVQNFGYLKSFVNAVGCSMEISGLTVNNCEVFGTVINSVSASFSSSLESIFVNFVPIQFYMKAENEFLRVSDVLVEEVNVKNSLNNHPCFYLSFFGIVNVTGMDNVEVSNVNIVNITNNNKITQTSLFLFSYSSNFSINGLVLKDSVMLNTNLVHVSAGPNFFLIEKTAPVIKNVVIQNVFSLVPVIRVTYFLMVFDFYIENVRATNCTIVNTNLIVVENLNYLKLPLNLLLETESLINAVKLNTGVYVSGLEVSNVILQGAVANFTGLYSVQLSNCSVSDVIVFNNYTNLPIPVIPSTSSPTIFHLVLNKNASITNIQAENFKINGFLIEINSNLGGHTVSDLNLNNILLNTSIFIFNTSNTQVLISSVFCSNSTFLSSAIYSPLVTNLKISNSVFTQVSSSVINTIANMLFIQNSDFQHCNSSSPLLLLTPLNTTSQVSVSNCKFFNNTGNSPIDAFITPGKSQMTVFFTNCTFSKSFGTSPISLAFNSSSEINSLVFENCSVSDFVTNNCKFYSDMGVFDISLDKGKVSFVNTKFEGNSNSQEMSPVVFHNSENSSPVVFVGCEMVNNENDVFLVQNNIFVKQFSVFEQCLYMNNGARVVLLQNADSVITDSQFLENFHSDDLISMYEKSSLTITNSSFLRNQPKSEGYLIQVSSAHYINCSSCFFSENSYPSTNILSLTSTVATLEGISTSKNRVYNIISAASSKISITNLTAEDDNSIMHISIKSSTFSISNSQFLNQNSVFESFDNSLALNSVSVTNSNTQVLYTLRTNITASNLNIKDSQGSISFLSSTLNFTSLQMVNSNSPTLTSSVMFLTNSNFFNTQGLTSENSELQIESTNFFLTSFALQLNSCNLTLANCNFDSSLSSAVQMYSSKATVALSSFLNNTSRAGGAIYLFSSVLSLDSNFFLQNRALDGGAIFYFNSSLLELNNSYVNNSAVHGKDKATPFSYLAPDAGNEYNVSSGQDLGNLQFYLKDELGQIVFTDNSSILDFESLSTVSLLTGSKKLFSEMGEVRLEGVVVKSPPGKTENFSLFVEGDSKGLNFSLIFTNCTVGEIQLLDNTCKECENNTYSLSLADQFCKPCPAEAVCQGKNLIFPASGYWSSPIFPESFYTCMNPSACLEGSPDSSSNCAFSYTGTLCGSCISGFKLKGSYNCSKCPDYWLSWLIVIISAFLILGFIAFMVYSNIKNLNKSKSEIALLLKILVNYAQTIVVLASIDLKWPSSILYLFDFSTVVGESSSQVVTLSCSEFDTDNKNYLSENIVTLLFPFIVTGLIFVVWGIVSLVKKDGRYVRVHFVSTFVVVVILLHTSISNSILSIFSCKKVNGVYWNTANYSLVCFETESMETILYVGVPGVIVWCLLVPLFLCFSLMRDKSRLQETDTMVKFKSLFSGYKPELFLWEFLIMLRKFLIRVVAILLISSGITIQGLGIMLILVFSLALHVHYRPYEKESINKLERYCIIVLILYVAGGIVFSTSLTEETKIGIGWVLFVVNLMFLVYWAKFFCRGVFDILGKTKFYNRIKNRFSVSSVKINVNNDQDVKLECTYKSGIEEGPDRSMDFMLPKNPSNSCMDVEEHLPRLNVWTVRYKE